MATETLPAVRQHPDGLVLTSLQAEARGYVEPKQIAGRYVLEDL